VEEDTTLVVRWQALGIPESSLGLPGEQLAEAWGRLLNYWNE